MISASLPADPARHLGILLSDGVEELDLAGPWEVLTVSCAPAGG